MPRMYTVSSIVSKIFYQKPFFSKKYSKLRGITPEKLLLG
jgi:hypothetical protein